MTSLLEVAVLVTVVLAVNGVTVSSNSNVSSAQQQQNAASPKIEAIATEIPSTTEGSHSALDLHSGAIPAPSDSLSMVVYAAVLITIVAMIYLVVRNFRMSYDTVRAERYGFRIRRGQRDHEVEPLARDDEDEEILFDVRGSLR